MHEHEYCQPRELNALMVNPTHVVLVQWTHAIQNNLERLKHDTASLQAFGMGDMYSVWLHNARSHPRGVHWLVLLVLIYLKCTPSASKNLSERDRNFLCHFNTDLGFWMMGKSSDGRSYGPGPGQCMDLWSVHTVGFVTQQMEKYVKYWQHALTVMQP